MNTKKVSAKRGYRKRKAGETDAQVIADKLGVHRNSVWNWRRSGGLPTNARVRKDYLKLIGKVAK